VQEPANISGNSIPTWLLILLILCILLVSGVAHYYRAELAQLIATLGFMLRHHSYKDILLDAAGRQSLFERLRGFEDGMKNRSPAQVYINLGQLIRAYMMDALGLKMECIPEEVAARCKQLHLRPETSALIIGLFDKTSVLEQENLEMNEYFIQATVEELRTVVCLTSDYKQEELLRPVEEIPVSDKMSFYDEIFARTTNALRAVQFNQIDVARKEYLTILTRYDPLTAEEKEQIYPQLRWSYDAIKFRADITGSKVVNRVAVQA
jgi:hypothetical protein